MVAPSARVRDGVVRATITAGARMAEDQTVQTIAEGKHIRLVRRGFWEFVTRKQVSGIVGIVAVTEDGKLLLVEQPRPALGKDVIELPAGLAGDAEGYAQEALADTAKREL